MSAGRRVILFELNEASEHFLRKLVGEGRLPTFERILREGLFTRTRIPGWDAADVRAWRDISPWKVWPSIYTGLSKKEHDIIAFGQDTSSIRGRCIWDLLNEQGVSIGVMGSLMSYPPRGQLDDGFYVPDPLSDDAQCSPERARAAQELCVFAARNYSEPFFKSALTSLRLLTQSRESGVTPATFARVLAQVPTEIVRGPPAEPERAMLLSYLSQDVFRSLYAEKKPRFATLHMNHIAYMQHRYWRAAEPHRFKDSLSPTDERFFRTVEQRKRYEDDFARKIAEGFEYADRLVADLMRGLLPGDVVIVASGLGQRPTDPVTEIHNPVVRLVHERELFDRVGLPRYDVLHQMNPDLTLNFQSVADAMLGAQQLGDLVIEGAALFYVERRAHQVFIELEMPRRAARGQKFRIRHKTRLDLDVPFERHIKEHRTNDQSTAHHVAGGWLAAFSPSRTFAKAPDHVDVTDIAPAVLALFDVEPAPWMSRDRSQFLIPRG